MSGPVEPVRGDELARLDEALRALPPIEPPPAVVARTLARVTADRGAARSRRALGWGLLATASALVASGVAVLAGGGATKDESVARGPVGADRRVSTALATTQGEARPAFEEQALESLAPGARAPVSELDNRPAQVAMDGTVAGQAGGETAWWREGEDGDDATGEAEGKKVAGVDGVGDGGLYRFEVGAVALRQGGGGEGGDLAQGDAVTGGVAGNEVSGSVDLATKDAKEIPKGEAEKGLVTLDHEGHIDDGRWSLDRGEHAVVVAGKEDEGGREDGWLGPRPNGTTATGLDGKDEERAQRDMENGANDKSLDLPREANERTEATLALDGDRDGAARRPPHGDVMVDENQPVSGRDELAGDLANKLDPATATDLLPTTRETRMPAVEDLSALAYIPARGYFQNTYVPGAADDATRRATLASGVDASGRHLALPQAAPVRQPFDRPVGQALALAVSADRAAVSGPTRVTLQVGLAAAARTPTGRAPLDLALVIDVPPSPDEAARRTLWGLAQAFIAERQAGDALALVVASGGAPVVLRGDALDAAAAARALEEAMSGPADTARGGLENALGAAYEAVAAAASKDAPVGANGVVLASTRAVDPALGQALGDLAARGATGQVSLTTIAVGPEDRDSDPLRELARAGAGRYLRARRPAEVPALVSGEVAASGRAVARALRLRIRLAPGVKLASVIGSRPLDAAATGAVRALEQSIDRRVAATLGIDADRGADEDGIQIVIPAFMAGDDHVVLLDVVVPGPGPVLDVRARWKDLVRMDNGEAVASLALPSGADRPTPITENVVENRAAVVAGDAMLRAASALGVAAFDRADRALAEAAREVAPLADRARSAADAAGLLARYRAAVREAAMNTGSWPTDYLARSLEVSGRTLK